MERQIDLRVNGATRSVLTDDTRTLLEVLREDLGLTGAKYGCGQGECGACTVIVGGARVRSCTMQVGRVEGREVETIEGLASNGALHPVQRAFLEKDAMQCGYCVPGQIMATVALLRQNPDPAPDEVVDAMRGNICRCCGYQNLKRAVRHAIEINKRGRVS